MRDCFTPVFLAALALLFAVQGREWDPGIFMTTALAAFALFLTFFLMKKNRAAYVCVALSLALLLAALFLRDRDSFERGRDIRLPRDEYVTIRGRLTTYPEIGDGCSWLLLRSRSFSWRRQEHLRELTVRVACNGDCREFNRGDEIEIAARVDARRPNRNFFANPYETYLMYKGIHLSAFSKSAQLVQVTERAPFFWRFIGTWRNRVRQVSERRYLKEGVLQPPGVFLEATLLGDRGRLENEEQEVMIGSGVFHLLAISGGNIAMLALVSLLLCRWLRFSLRLRYGATALLLLLFLAVSGFDVSAARAVLMALLFFAGRVWFMDAEPSNVLSFCGLLLLAASPAQFLDPGFILTFALTASILVGRRIFLPLLKGLPRWAGELLSANASAASMALPLSLHYFQRYAFSGFFSTLLLAPLAAGVTICGALLLLLVWLPPAVASLTLLPAGLFLEFFFQASGWIYENASWSVFRPSPPLWLPAAVGVLFFLVSLDKLKIGWRIVSALLAAGCLVFVSLPPRRYRPEGLDVYFLDVGHGDAQVVVFQSGDALLVDAGGSSRSDFQVGRRLVLPFLIQKRIRVRWVAVSHCHPDHVKGVSEIIGVLKPEELWISSSAVDYVHYNRLLAAKPAKTRLRKVARGFGMRVDGWSLVCLAPPRFIEAAGAANNHSMVLRVSDSRFSLLLAGDIEKEVESELASSFGSKLASSVLKIAHHGSRTSSSGQFLDSVGPQIAVISAPAYSAYGFPHSEVIGRLKERGIRWLTTARSGGIRMTPTPMGLAIEASR